jgi:toxin YhaV
MTPVSRERAPAVPERHGWKLLAWAGFAEQYGRLVASVEALRRKDPTGYAAHPQAKLLAAVQKLVLDVIPRDPGADIFRQGNTLGPAHRHWFRARFHQRFRIFYRFHTARRVIVFAWMSEEGTQRKEGARTDPYHVFRGMLERGSPPSDMDQLLAESRALQYS